MDFLKISKRYPKQGVVEISPKFVIGKSNDLMIRGGDFYAIWVEERGLWSTDEDDVKQLVDAALDEYAKENTKSYEGSVSIMYMWDSDTGTIDKWHKYCQKQQRDSFHMLDENLLFANDKVKKRDYASKRLDYPLECGEIPSYDKIMSTLYTEDERHKLEWAIGAVVTGDSKKIQKFLVLYGSAGTGKSTVLNIIQLLFEGYYSSFDARTLGSSSNSFALEAFKTNPLVAIQHDGDLSHIEDNTRLNSLVSHEMMTVNEKFKSSYDSKFKSFLFMGTNKPVKITDAKSGLIRRLIDVTPSGNTLGGKEYKECTKQVKFELGAIAWHCKEVYLNNPGAYDNYIPTAMLGASNDFYNYVIDSYHIFKRDDGVTLKSAWELYKTYCEDAKVPYPFSQRNFKEELKNYFSNFEDRFALDDGTRVRSYYTGFLSSKFEYTEPEPIIKKLDNEIPDWLTLIDQPSIFDSECAQCLAQYANDQEVPISKWENVKTKLSLLKASRLHYVKVPINHIVIDFDIPDADGNKSYELNAKAASLWPPTYAEVSKGGAGIHLHYWYTGDPEMLSRIYDEHIEVKVFNGNSSLRRRLTKCNKLAIATISSGLPLKGVKVVNNEIVATERSLRTTIKKCLNKEIHSGTKPSIDFIFKVLEDAYTHGIKYDLSDMKNTVIGFGAQSTHNSSYCLGLIGEMHFTSDEEFINMPDSVNPDKPMVFYDIEVFPNLFVVNWKIEGEGKPVVRMINPTPEQIETVLTMKLVGFNNRKYDNHIMYARMMGYDNMQLYKLSKKIIDEGVLKAGFREAYNLSYTDVYDFASAGNKKSLKKLEIEMGIHHLELGLPWDKPVPEHLWNKVAEYCDNDVLATEAAFHYLSADWTARCILVDIAGMTANDTTNNLTTRIIFGNEKHPQDQFNWRDLSQPVKQIPEDMREFLTETFPEMMAKPFDDKSVLPYFPGYKYSFGKSTYRDVNADNPDKDQKVVGEGGNVYAEEGMYINVALLDITSQHPHSAMAEVIFGVKFTRAFKEIVYGRVNIKHEAWDAVNNMLDGKLTPYIQLVINGEMTCDQLADALKTAINAVYGLTSASFDNAFKDKRNIDNIVAKRGALFMIDLRHAVQEQGFTVAHIKTDSIKIPDATPEIIQFVMDFGKRYGYSFEHEATYDRMCLVNNAVYIAKFASVEKCEKLYGYAPKKNKKYSNEWTATGTQFAVPYVFKTLFTHEDLEFNDLCEVFSVQAGDLYLDMNENLPDVTDLEKQRDKIIKTIIKESSVMSIIKDRDEVVLSDPRYIDITEQISVGHDLQFVGRVGQFSPVKQGCGGGGLYRVKDGKNYNATGASGFRWLESETVKEAGLKNDIDMNFYIKMADEAMSAISKYGDFEWFVSDDPYISPYVEDEPPFL